MMGFQTKSANAHHPQIVTLIIDDSGSMEGSKAKQVTEAIQDGFVIELQSKDLQSSRFRFLLNIAKFGDDVVPLAVAKIAKDVNLQALTFKGDSGQTNIAAGLHWAKEALETSLQYCRGLTDYDEEQCPNPLCILFTDGENTGPDVAQPAQTLRSVPFKGGQVDVFVCGIGLDKKDFATAQAIASDPALATNIGPNDIGRFIAQVTITVVENKEVRRLNSGTGNQQAIA
jgi:uncharacterized protein YegL